MTKIEKPIYISREEKDGITQDVLKKLFFYKNGFLHWRENRCSNKIKKGTRAGYIETSKGEKRLRIRINYKCYLASRLIFCWHYGYFPEFIDHIDINPLNNKIENLRIATKAENCRNRTPQKNASSKYKGVSYVKASGKWVVSIRANYIPKYLGIFTNETEAALVYNRAAVKYFGEFAYLNIIKPEKNGK